VSCQVNGKPVVGQGEPKPASKDGSPKRKKRKVSKVAIDSEVEGEAVEVTAEPEARPHNRAWTGPVEELPEAGEGVRGGSGPLGYCQRYLGHQEGPGGHCSQY